MFEKFARRCSRRHKQTTFSDAGFLGALRVKMPSNAAKEIAPHKVFFVVVFFFQPNVSFFFV